MGVRSHAKGLTKLEQVHIQVARLCIQALLAPESPDNKAHCAVLSILPEGVYRHYKGKRWFADRITRKLNQNGEHYYVHAIPLDTEDRIPIQILLVGTEHGSKGWFMPAHVRGGYVERFTLECVIAARFVPEVQKALMADVL